MWSESKRLWTKRLSLTGLPVLTGEASGHFWETDLTNPAGGFSVVAKEVEKHGPTVDLFWSQSFRICCVSDVSLENPA